MSGYNYYYEQLRYLYGATSFPTGPFTAHTYIHGATSFPTGPFTAHTYIHALTGTLTQVYDTQSVTLS